MIMKRQENQSKQNHDRIQIEGKTNEPDQLLVRRWFVRAVLIFFSVDLQIK